MRTLKSILCCAAATAVPVSTAAAQDTQLLCGVEVECVNGNCTKPQGAAHRQVIFILPRDQKDHIELGTYDGVFNVGSEFDIPKHRRDFLTGTRVYRWSTADGGTAQIKVHSVTPAPEPNPADGAVKDLRQRPFTYDRDVTVGGTKTPAHSSGLCFDPTYVLLGPSMVPGVIHSDENERYLSDPSARSELVAHCKLQPANAGSEVAGLDLWLVADAPGTACVLDMASDGLLCFEIRETKSGKLFESAFGDTNLRLLIRPNGTATYKDVESGSDGAASRTTKYSGTCEKGPAFQ